MCKYIYSVEGRTQKSLQSSHQMEMEALKYCTRHSSRDTNLLSVFTVVFVTWQSLHTFPPLTHWFLDDSVVVWGIIGIHWLQERPRHFMCLRRREGPRDGEKQKDKTVEKAETNEEKQTPPLKWHWKQVGQHRCSLSFFSLSLLHTRTTGQRRRKTRGEEVEGGEREKKGEARKNAGARQLSK